MARPIKRPRRTIFFALAGSLLLHVLPFAGSFLKSAKAPANAAPPPIEARLASLPPPPPLHLDDAEQETPRAKTHERRKKKPRPETAPAKSDKSAEQSRGKQAPKWTDAVRQHLEKLDQRGLFYPREAIARGMEGEVLILLTIDPSGLIIAARIEQSSGYKLLDEAAINAVRSLRSLPDDAPRQAVLPVRFRLR